MSTNPPATSTSNLPAYAVVLITLAVIASMTYLVAIGKLSADALTAVLGVVTTTAGATGALHVVNRNRL